MNFIRWIVLERFLPALDSGQLTLALVVSIIPGSFITATLWPWSLPLALVIVGFWLTIAYVVVAEWLNEMQKEWKQETKQDN